ncbi:MAG: hypothetical protein ACYTF3_04820 [Planctomycetota bacterium]|jgi:hypothetical protein
MSIPKPLLLSCLLPALGACAVPVQDDAQDPEAVTAAFLALDLEDREAAMASMRAAFDEDLGLVGEAVPPAESGTSWLMNRGRFKDVTLVRGGGAYFSFETGTNDYNQGPDLSLAGWEFSSGFYGGTDGYVASLPAENLEAVQIADVPAPLTTLPLQRLRDFDRAACVEGGVYAVRSSRAKEGSDRLVAFQVEEVTELGARIRWRLLKAYPTEVVRR